MPGLILVRHGATAYNATGRYQGHVDPPLSPEGERQARALGERLRALLGADWRPTPGAAPGDAAAVTTALDATAPDATAAGAAAGPPVVVYASDLRRSRQTAALALPDVEVRVDRRLRELDFGAFDGRSYDDNLARHGERFRAWIDDPARVRPPGGESLAELATRIGAWYDALPRTGRVVAFTHGGPIRAILARARGVPFLAVRHLAIPPCSVIRAPFPELHSPETVSERI